MRLPLVSVLVPVYNGEAYLSEALQSIAGQTYPNFEVVISDDGSSDSSTTIAERWAATDRRFRVRANAHNLGMTENWNAALADANGDYVAKLDCDDVARPRFLEELVTALEAEPMAPAAFCRTISCDEKLEPFASYLGDNAFVLGRIDPLQRHVKPGHAWYEISFEDIQLWHSNAQLHRRDDLRRLGAWDATWGCGSDTDLILRVLESDRPVVHLPYAGVWYRHRSGSVSNDSKRTGWLVWESQLIPVLSLARVHRSGVTMSPNLRRQWWRHWNNLQELKRQTSLSAFPEPIAKRLSRALSLAAEPPTSVVARGRTRDLASKLVHSLGSGAFRTTVKARP